MSPYDLSRLNSTIAHLSAVAQSLEADGKTEAAAHIRDGLHHLREHWRNKIAALPTPEKQRYLDELAESIGKVSIDDLPEA